MAAVRPLNDTLSKIAKDELNEVESRLPEDIAALREWIDKQPHLRAPTDDQMLTSFLRGCKHSLEKAKSKIDNFYTIKTMMPEMFANNIVNEQSLAFCRTGIYVNLPTPLGEGGPRIRLTNYAKFDFKKYHLKDLFRYQILIMCMCIRDDDNCIINGHVEVIDLSKTTLSFLAQLDPIVIKKLGVFSEKAQPMRMKGVHIVNAPKEAHTLITFARSLMSSKLQQRFYVHKTLEDLYKHIPKEYLPAEYGGTNGTTAEIQADTEQKLLALADYLKDCDKYGVDEKLRPGKQIDTGSMFGIDGSFRKLDID